MSVYTCGRTRRPSEVQRIRARIGRRDQLLGVVTEMKNLLKYLVE